MRHLPAALRRMAAAALMIGGLQLPLAAGWRLEKADSWIKFQPHARFGGGAGEFKEFDAAAVIDPARLEATQLTVTIDIASIDTGIKKRDKHLRSEDFFDAARHPQAQFVLKSLKHKETYRYIASGDLTLRGVTRGLAFPVKIDAASQIEVGGEAVVPRKDFGISYDSALNPIRDEVKIFFHLRFIPQ